MNSRYVVVPVAFTLVLGWLLLTAYFGRQLARMRRSSTLSPEVVTRLPQYQGYFRMHKRAMNMTLATTILAICITDWWVRTNGGSRNVFLFRFHLFFAFSFFALFLLIRFKATGEDWVHKRIHGRLAYICLGLFLCAFGTALPLLPLFKAP